MNLDATGRPELRITPIGLPTIRLQRIDDREVRELARFCAPIQRDTAHELFVSHRAKPLALPRVFVGAEACFGKSSDRDNEKGSFRFPLLVSLRRDQPVAPYLAFVEDVRGVVRLPFYRIHRELVATPDTFHAPVDHELSRSDLNAVFEYVLGYLEGFAIEAATRARSFFRTVRSELLVYGSRHGDLFERSCESREELDRVVRAIEQELGPVQRADDLARVDALLAEILGDGTGLAT